MHAQIPVLQKSQPEFDITKDAGPSGCFYRIAWRISFDAAFIDLLFEQLPGIFKTRLKQLGDAGRDRVRSEFIWADQAAKLKPFLD